MIHYCLNPNLIVSELSGSGFAVYAPPEPSPYRFNNELWTALSAWKGKRSSKEEWVSYLLESTISDDKSYDFKGLVDINILVPVEIPVDTQEQTNNQYLNQDILASKFSPNEQSNSDVGESTSIKLIKINPLWPNSLRRFLLSLFWLQIKLLPLTFFIVSFYLLFYLVGPVASGSLFYDSVFVTNTNFDALSRVLVGLISVNLFSTITTWLAQSLTGNGDGWFVLRFIFGIIPRFGVHSYSGSALRSDNWSAESNKAFLCIAQPLLSRLFLSSTLILLISSGRLQGNVEDSYIYSLANIVLQISLVSFLILALPFRMSPGYRLMILFTDLPPSTLGQSVSKFYLFCSLILNRIRVNTKESRDEISDFLSSKRNILLISFASIFLCLMLAKLFLISFVAIPRLATGSPELFGRASQFIFTILLFALLFRFVRLSIVPKLAAIKSRTSFKDSKTVDQKNEQTMNKSKLNIQDYVSSENFSRKSLIIAFSGLVLFFPINRTITGSVVVSNERDLTVRASDDVRLLSVFEDGPSTRIISQGTHLIQLESIQIEKDLSLANTQIVEYKQNIDTLRAQLNTVNSLLLEADKSLSSYKRSIDILTLQINDASQLLEMGAVSKQYLQELFLSLYELEEEERTKLQEKIQLESDINDIRIKIQASESSLIESSSWLEALLNKKKDLLIRMPFDGLITSNTSGLKGSFFPKGESILELREGSLHIVNVLVPDHDRSLINVGQEAVVRLYANPNKSLLASVSSIKPSSESIDEKVYFQVSLRLNEPLSPSLLQSSGAARINAGNSNLLFLTLTSIGRFINVDVWSWTP